MILKALYDYYQRSGNDVAPLGLEYKDISFIIVIDKNGFFKRVENNAVVKLVAKNNGRTGTTSQPNHLWDKFSYVFGISNATIRINDISLPIKKLDKYKKEIHKNERNHRKFVDYITELNINYPYDEDLKAVINFYIINKDLLGLLQNCDIWDIIKRNLNKNVSFLIQGDKQIIAEKKSILSYYNQNKKHIEPCKDSICLVTGEKCIPIKTFTKIKFGKYNDTKLISFKKNNGYDSYNKEQGDNATMSESSENSISTALKKLLAFDSRNKFSVGERTYVFWTSRINDINLNFEDSIYSLFGYNDYEDNPNRNIDKITQVFRSIYNGNTPNLYDDKFYVLGMFAANKGRIAVSYWNETTVRNFAGNIIRHFKDMEIIDSRKDKKPYVGLHSILGSVTLGGKSSDVTPNLPDAVVKSVFQGTPYPFSLFQSCIRRIRSEVSLVKNGRKIDPVNIVRAAIIKAYLNRINNENNNLKINIMLDKENQNQGYLCGRLFAVLDKIQEEANGIHSIRERYMNSASSTPSTVFATILNLSTHHQEKLSIGGQIKFEKLKQEIISKLEADGFPSHLNLQDQGRFFVGYYHQRQDFFIGKDVLENSEIETEN